MPFYPTQPGPQLLVDMFNAIRGTAYTTDDFTFGTPKAVTREDGRNTSVDLTVARGVLTGQVSTMFYTRLDLALLLTPREIELNVDSDVTQTGQLAAAFNTLFGWSLSDADFIDIPLEELSDTPVSQTLMAHPDSLICIGSGTVSLTQGAFGVTTYNTDVDTTFVDSGSGLTLADTSNDFFARFNAGNLEIALRFMSEDADSNFIDTPSDGDDIYPLPVLDTASWYMALGIAGSQGPVLAAAGRLQLVATVEDEEVIYPIGWNGTKYTINLGGWLSQSFGHPAEAPNTGMFRLSMTHAAFGANFASVPANSNNTLLADFDFEVQILNADLDQVMGSLPISVSAAPPPSIVAPNIYEAYGLNGVLYVVGPSFTPMVKNGTFESVYDDTMQGYEFGPAKFAKYIEDTIYIDFSYSGYASNYTGTLDNVKLYGCDPMTGAIVETINIGQVAWDYQYIDNYVGDPIELNPALAWRGQLTLNIVSSAGDPPMNETIDLVVGREEPYPDFDIEAIDGVPVVDPHPVPTKTYHSNALRNEDHLTSIIYSTSSYTIADGPHTVTMRFQGVEHELAFEMVGT